MPWTKPRWCRSSQPSTVDEKWNWLDCNPPKQLKKSVSRKLIVYILQSPSGSITEAESLVTCNFSIKKLLENPKRRPRKNNASPQKVFPETHYPTHKIGDFGDGLWHWVYHIRWYLMLISSRVQNLIRCCRCVRIMVAYPRVTCGWRSKGWAVTNVYLDVVLAT